LQQKDQSSNQIVNVATDAEKNHLDNNTCTCI